MPRRGMPGTYPAPPLECTARGLIRLRPAMPVPCSRVIFSSIVISFTTIDARSSGDRLGFDQGCDLGFCADEDRATVSIMTGAMRNRFSRGLPGRGILFSSDGSRYQIVYVTPFCEIPAVNFVLFSLLTARSYSEYRAKRCRSRRT